MSSDIGCYGLAIQANFYFAVQGYLLRYGTVLNKQDSNYHSDGVLERQKCVGLQQIKPSSSE